MTQSLPLLIGTVLVLSPLALSAAESATPPLTGTQHW